MIGTRLSDVSTRAQELNGYYLYGVTRGAREESLGNIGINGAEVHTLPFQEITAVINRTPDKPYKTTDLLTLKGWLSSHNHVLEIAGERFGTVIPAGFNTMIRTSIAGIYPERVLLDWLTQEYPSLMATLEKLDGKDEYAVQVWYEPNKLVSQVSCPQIDQLNADIKSPGRAYLYRQMLEKVTREETEKFIGGRFGDYINRIRRHCQEIVQDKVKPSSPDKVMLMNLSCLVNRDNVGALGRELDGINSAAGFSVHFSGPWPAYSFVGDVIMQRDN